MYRDVYQLRNFPRTTSGTKYMFQNNYPVTFDPVRVEDHRGIQKSPINDLGEAGIVTSWVAIPEMTKSYWQAPLDSQSHQGCTNCSLPESAQYFSAPRTQVEQPNSNTLRCGDGDCGKGHGKLSILDPKFNLREVCKHCALLEDHLFQKNKRCEQCVRKHLLTIEAFLEEAVTLDEKGDHTDEIEHLLHLLNEANSHYVHNRNFSELGQRMRVIRKALMTPELFECAYK
jgi:hypothetical protein